MFNEELEKFNNSSNIEKILKLNLYYEANAAYFICQIIKDESSYDIFLIYLCLIFKLDIDELYSFILNKNNSKTFSSWEKGILGFGVGADSSSYNPLSLAALLKNYLEKNKNNNDFKDRINKLFDDVLNNFIDKYESFIILGDNRLDIYKFAAYFFEKNKNINLLNKLFENLLDKNPSFIDFDYKCAFCSGLYYATKIKGLYRKISISDLNRILCYTFDVIGDAEKKDVTAYFIKQLDDIYELNKDGDEEALYDFFNKINSLRKPLVNDELFKLLESREYYRKYSSKDSLCKVYDNIINEILSGNIGYHDLIVMAGLGCYSNFINLDYLKLFMDSKSIEFKKSLLIPIIYADLTKLRKEKNLTFSINFGMSTYKWGLDGVYIMEKDALFISKEHILKCRDPLRFLVKLEYCLYHEVMHAEQSKLLMDNPMFNSNNLLMSIDSLLPDSYYEVNYHDISYEKDANAQAFVYAMTYFEKYPRAKDLVLMCFSDSVDDMKNYVKLVREEGSNKEYSNLFQLFLDYAAQGLSAFDYYKYPLLEMVFERDPKDGSCFLKSDDYFEDLRSKYMNDTDSIEKREALRCLDMIDYQKRVKQFFIDNGNYSGVIVTKGIDGYDDLRKSIENLIGKPPEVKR